MEEKIVKLEQLYNELTDLTPDKMEMLVSESIKTFEQILGKLQNGTEEEKKKAAEYAERLRDNLEKQAEKAIENLQLSTEDMEKFTSDPSNFSEEEWEALQRAKSDLESYQTDVVKRGFVKEEDLNKKNKVKRKKQKPLWVAS